VHLIRAVPGVVCAFVIARVSASGMKPCLKERVRARVSASDQSDPGADKMTRNTAHEFKGLDACQDTLLHTRYGKVTGLDAW
jgi:hypothetical protein